MAEPRFEIVTGAKARAARPDEGTITRGVGRSPWTGETIAGDYIKAEAQAGRMGQMLYAVAMKRAGGFEFRAPTAEDLAVDAASGSRFAAKRPRWDADGSDRRPRSIPDGNESRSRAVVQLRHDRLGRLLFSDVNCSRWRSILESSAA